MREYQDEGETIMSAKFRGIKPCPMLNPVPAVMVSCRRNAEETPNILTVAWAGTVNTDPPMVSISVQKRRFSHDIITESGEFVVNLVDASLCRAMDWCGVKSGRDVDKFKELKLTPIAAEGLETAQAIEECPAYLSCKVHQVIELGSHDLIIGRIVAVQVRDEWFDSDGSMHLERAGLVSYNHGVYQKNTDILGFFGYSVAREEVRRKRMAAYRVKPRK